MNDILLSSIPLKDFETLIRECVKSELQNLSSASHNESDQLLTIKEAGEFLHLSVPTLYGYVRRNEIPFSKKSKRLYFSKKELTEYIQTGRKKTIGEINAEANTYLKKRG